MTDKPAQREFDFTVRGHQLQLLDKVRFSSRKASRMKAVLKAVDSCLGNDPSWVIPLSRLCEITGYGRATVSRAVTDLAGECVLIVTDRTGPAGNQLASRFQISWANLVDFLPCAKPVNESPREVKHPPLKVKHPPSKLKHPVSVWGEGSASLAPLTRPDPTKPVPSRKQPRGIREGKNLFDETTAGDLRSAVRKNQPDLIQRLWEAGSQWGTVADGDRLRFFAAAVYVALAPPDEVTDPVRLLAHKLRNRDWRTGRRDHTDETRARELIRLCDRGEEPRTGNVERQLRDRDRRDDSSRIEPSRDPPPELARLADRMIADWSPQRVLDELGDQLHGHAAEALRNAENSGHVPRLLRAAIINALLKTQSRFKQEVIT